MQKRSSSTIHPRKGKYIGENGSRGGQGVSPHAHGGGEGVFGHDGNAGEGLKNPASAAKTLMTRRGFLFGTIGVVAAATVAGTVYGTTQCSKKEVVPQDGKIAVGDLAVLNVPESSVFTTEECTYIEDSTPFVRIKAEAKLPYGTMLWASDDAVAACLLPCETSNPLCQVGLLNLADGSMTTVLERAVAQDEGFEIYDVRANAKGVVWTEADIMNGLWRIYAASLAGMSLGTPQMVAQGDGDFDTPTLAVSGDFAFWQTLPKAKGKRSKESSVLMRAQFGRGEEDSKVVYESNGRMACDPSTAADGIVIAPRADVSGTYYELTYIDASSGQVLDSLALPSQMKPTYVSYGDTGFSFAFDSIYSYGGGISNLGTYTALSPKLANDTPWFRFPRTPYTSAAWNSAWLIVKSTSVVAAVDLEQRRYFTLAPEVATQGYGEFLASSGNVKTIVTYSNVDHVPLQGEKITSCLVRVWEVDPTAVPTEASEGDGESGADAGEGDAAQTDAGASDGDSSSAATADDASSSDSSSSDADNVSGDNADNQDDTTTQGSASDGSETA